MTENEVEALIQTELQRVRESYDDGQADKLTSASMLCRIDRDGKKLEDGKYSLAYVVMTSDVDYRQAAREQAWASDAVFVALALEMWSVEVPEGASQELKDQVAAARAIGRLQDVDKSVLQERVRVHVESEWTPHRWFDARILRENGKITLSPWTELKVQAPRPGFRRYLPERVDGQRVLKINLPSAFGLQ